MLDTAGITERTLDLPRQILHCSRLVQAEPFLPLLKFRVRVGDRVGDRSVYRVQGIEVRGECRRCGRRCRARDDLFVHGRNGGGVVSRVSGGGGRHGQGIVH